MVKLKSKVKGQALPLNTIVIAILVIIVLLVIIVFFTTKMGDSGETFDQSNPTKCTMTNPAVTTLGYTQVDDTVRAEEGCNTANGWQKISVVPSWKVDEVEYICCGYKE